MLLIFDNSHPTNYKLDLGFALTDKEANYYFQKQAYIELFGIHGLIQRMPCRFPLGPEYTTCHKIAQNICARGLNLSETFNIYLKLGVISSPDTKNIAIWQINETDTISKVFNVKNFNGAFLD